MATGVGSAAFVLIDSVSHTEENLWDEDFTQNVSKQQSLMPEHDEEDEGTEEPSSDEESEEEEDSDDEDEEDSDEEDDDDSDDDSAASSDSSSLGSTIERMEAEAAASGRPLTPPPQAMAMLGLGGTRGMGSNGSIGSGSTGPGGMMKSGGGGMRRNNRSMPNLLELVIPAGGGADDASAALSMEMDGSKNSDMNRSLRSFMTRMNSAQLYIQDGAVGGCNDGASVATTKTACRNRRKDRAKANTNNNNNAAAAAGDLAISDPANSKPVPRKSRSANALGEMMEAEKSSKQRDSPAKYLERLWDQVIMVEGTNSADTATTVTTASTTDGEDNGKDNGNESKKKKDPPVTSFKEWIPASYWDGYFEPISDQRVEGYTKQSVAAMRGTDVETLRQIVQEHGPEAMNACNRQGESLLHLACRRRNYELLQFMLQDAKASLAVRDDWNKTPLHELCWYSQTSNENDNNREWQSIVLTVIQQAPELLFARDRRGFLPLQYVPKDCWKDWNQFLEDNEALLKWRIDYLDFQRIRHRLQLTLVKAKEQIQRQKQRQQQEQARDDDGKA